MYPLNGCLLGLLVVVRICPPQRVENPDAEDVKSNENGERLSLPQQTKGYGERRNPLSLVKL